MSLPPLLSTVDTYTQSALEFQQIKKEAQLSALMQHQQGLVASPPKDGKHSNQLRSSSTNAPLRAAKPKDGIDKSGTAGVGKNNTPRFRGNGSKHVVATRSDDAKDTREDKEIDCAMTPDANAPISGPLTESPNGNGSGNSNSSGNKNGNYRERSNSIYSDSQTQKENRNINNRPVNKKSNSNREAKQVGRFLMGEEVHPSFARAIEALAAIRLHAFSRKRKDLIQQKMDLLNEIRTYQKENFEDAVDSIQVQFQFILAAWKIRYFVELGRFKQLKKKSSFERRQFADKEERFKRELDSIMTLVNERKVAFDDLRVTSAKAIDDLRGQTAQLSLRELSKDEELVILRKKLSETEYILSKVESEVNKDRQVDLNIKNKIRDLENKCTQLTLELGLTRKSFEDVMLKNSELEKENTEARNVLGSLETIKRDNAYKLELLDASFQSQQSIMGQELESCRGMLENSKLMIDELNQRNSKLEQVKSEARAAFDNQSLTNIDISAELSRTIDEKASLQIVITDLALKYQKLEADHNQQGQQLDKVQTKYNLSRVQKAELKIIVQIMETEIHTLKDKLKHESENMLEQVRQSELSMMKTEDVEVGWSVTLNSLIKTAGYCRFLEDQLFSMRKIRGQTPSTGGNGSDNLESQFFNTWSDSSYNPNSSNGANGSRIKDIEDPKGSRSPNREGNNNQQQRPDNKKVSFAAPSSDGDDNNNDSSFSASNKSNSAIVQNLEDQLKMASQVTDSVLKLMMNQSEGGNGSGGNWSFSPQKSSQAVSYTVQKEQLLRVFGIVEKKLSRVKDELNDDNASIKRAYESIHNLLDRKSSLVSGIRTWWDKWLLTNLKIPSQEDFKWHLSVIGETIEGCDLNIYSILTSIYDVVSNLKQKSDLVADLEGLFGATKSVLQRLNKGVSNDEIITVLQDFERLEIEASHLNTLFADPNANIEPQQLLAMINSSMVSLSMQPFTVFWSIAIPAYVCFVNNDFPVTGNSRDDNNNVISLQQPQTTPADAALAKAREIYQINLKKTQDIEKLLGELKDKYESNLHELSNLSVSIFKEEEKMKDWVMQYMRICKREPILVDKQHSQLFMQLHTKYESFKDNILNLYDDTDALQADIIKFMQMHEALKVFLKEHCKVCFDAKDINDAAVLQCEPASRHIIDRLNFKTLQELGSDIHNNYMPIPTVSKEIILSAESQSKSKVGGGKAAVAATATGGGGGGHHHAISSGTIDERLVEKVVHSQADLGNDKFLTRIKTELKTLKTHLSIVKDQRSLIRRRLNEASRLLNIWLQSYKTSHDGREPSEEIVHNLAKDIVEGFNSCSTDLTKCMNEITTVNASIKERRDIMNHILVVRKDLSDISWFEEEDLGKGRDLEEEGSGSTYMLPDLKELIARDSAGSLTASLVVDQFPPESSLVSDISFSLDNTRSEIIIGGGGMGDSVAAVGAGPGHLQIADNSYSERPVNDYEISSIGLESIDKEIGMMKRFVKELKGEYERIKELYSVVDNKRASSRNALNDWSEQFQSRYSRVPTEVEKHSECHDLIASLQDCQDRLIECFNSMSDLKVKFDSGQVRLGSLKERREKIFDAINN